MKTLIKNGKIIRRENQLIEAALQLENGVIHAIEGSFGGADFEQVFDANGRLIVPGLMDVRIHFREPSSTYRGMARTGSKAAARGGFTTVCAMPSLNPVLDTTERLSEVHDLVQGGAVAKVSQYAPITEEPRSEVLTNQKALKEAGISAFTNDDVGAQTVETIHLAMKEVAVLDMILVTRTEDESLLFGDVMHEGEASKKLGLPGILSVTEASQVARDITLAKETGAHYYVCHISTEESVCVVRDAKKAGIHVTAEVLPHHLVSIDEDIPGDEGFQKMNPSLHGLADRQALIDGLLDGTIDCIATDHAPHGLEKKQQSFLNAPSGIVGNETTFQLTYTNLAETGIFTLEQMIDWMAVRPAEIPGLNAGTLTIGASADIIVSDLVIAAPIDTGAFEPMAVSTPFTGWVVKGKTLTIFVDGALVWSEEAQWV